MKISTFVMFLAVLGGFFIVFALMSSEINQEFPDANIDSSNWSEQYDYANDINRTLAPLQSTFEKIEDPNTGWFSAIVLGIAAVPRALTTIPILLFTTFGYGGEVTTSFFTFFLIPISLMIIAFVVIFVWGIFKLLEVYQRWQL